MSARRSRRPSLRRVCVSSVVVALLGTTLLTGAASGRGPDQVHRRRHQRRRGRGGPSTRSCAEDPEKCTWNNDERVNVDYGPARVIGDVLYNCSTDDPDQEEAETAVGVAQEREESTSLEEEISVEASLSFLDLASSSVKAWAKSNQSESFGTTVEATEATTVPPGYKGWTQASLLSLNVTGSAYITDGIDLIQVTNIAATYPGVHLPERRPAGRLRQQGRGDDGRRGGLALPDHGADPWQRRDGRGCGSTGSRVEAAPRALHPHHLPTLGRHRRFRASVRADACHGAPGAARPRKVRATLTRGGVTYASERDRTGDIRLVQRRTITPGYYTLTIREKSKPIVVRHRGKLHEARQEYYVTVPLMIRWFRKG